ncbi:hypothetical protein [Dyadobacter arcticus]|uniref:Dienelactone hydrolase n=1 Tax=Dyadobacter arcticus TaxID=1078754 RepID=A0ABX0UJY2_9BACT|nr:hypothetical protein [Dyadobacter arcticus]NIJ53327.1 putative dienelactone hydrolase [Dyadobacter arcticus]
MKTEITTSANKKSDLTIADTIGQIRSFFAANPSNGMQLGVSALSKTVMRRLPAPLNLIPAVAIEKVILNYAVPEGRELLLRGLRWVKKATDEEPADFA